MSLPFRWFSQHWCSPTVAASRQQLPLIEDFKAIFERDPAANHWLEVLLCSPGLHAIALHRLAHWLYQRQVLLLPRLMSHFTRWLTGIEIHPGACLGRGVVIDHGMGVVIGETAIVGDYTLIYQGVTLGGTGKETGKRHPTIGNHVVIGAGAKILGNLHIGDFARIGAGSIVLKNVPAHCTAVGIPSRNVCRCNTRNAPLEHNQLPDATAIAIRAMGDRIAALEAELASLKTTLTSSTASSASSADLCPSSDGDDCPPLPPSLLPRHNALPSSPVIMPVC